MKKILNLCVALSLFATVVITFASCGSSSYISQGPQNISIENTSPNYCTVTFDPVYDSNGSECSYKFYWGETDNFSDVSNRRSYVNTQLLIGYDYYFIFQTGLEPDDKEINKTLYLFIEAYTTYGDEVESKVSCKKYDVTFYPIPAPKVPKVKKTVDEEYVTYELYDYKVEGFSCYYDVWMQEANSSSRERWIPNGSTYKKKIKTHQDPTFYVMAYQGPGPRSSAGWYNYSEEVEATIVEESTETETTTATTE